MTHQRKYEYVAQEAASFEFNDKCLTNDWNKFDCNEDLSDLNFSRTDRKLKQFFIDPASSLEVLVYSLTTFDRFNEKFGFVCDQKHRQLQWRNFDVDDEMTENVKFVIEHYEKYSLQM